MAKTRFMQVTLLRSALLGATALALVNSPLVVRDAAAKVGVTSATDGDPLGKPPQEAERVLRIGIDVQANELITTSANDRAHLVFLDGSSLTVGPNAQLTIDKFVFDPNTKTGELAISASKGVLRLVGGKISKNTPITITTPSSTIGIRGGISVHDVSQRRTDSWFVFGKDMVVRGNNGPPQVATRQSSMITAMFGQAAGAAVLAPPGTMNGPLAQLEGRPNPSGNSSSGGGGGAGKNADRTLTTSGFSTVNSNQAPRIIAPGVADNFGAGPGPRNRNPNDTFVTVLTNANQGVQQQFAVQDQRNQQGQQAAALGANQSIQQPDVPLPPPPTAPPTVNNPRGLTVGPTADSTVPDVSQINQMTSTATYAGVLAGLRGNGAGQFGSYQNVWNFATRSGNASVSFGGANFQGTTFGNGNSATFSTRGPITSSNVPDQKLELNGSFFGSRTNPTAFQGGNFTITGGQRTGGVFGAIKQ